MEKIIRFFKDEDGLELSEYAVMGGLIILGLVGVIGALHAQIGSVFTQITGAMTPTTGGGSNYCGFIPCHFVDKCHHCFRGGGRAAPEDS